MLLEVKNLSVYYGKSKAIDNVSLNVQEGEIVTIVGANGAGKTTIMRTLSALKRAVSGEIWFQNKRVDRMRPDSIVRMGMIQVPAGRMIYAPMTVEDNLKMGYYLRSDRTGIKKDLESIYQHFPILKERRGQLGGSLSGGEQQMLAVARALMGNPRLLLMDEPSVGLSPLLVAEVGNIIRDINKSGISVLLVEQNCRMALKLAQRAYILEIGAIVLEGDADKLACDERVKKYYLGGG